MVSQRERLKERGLVQISIWLPQDVADRLKEISEQRGLSATKAVEAAIMAFAESPEPIPASYPHSTSIPIPDDLLERVKALESRSPAQLHDLTATLWERIESKLDARSDADIDVLASRITRQSAEVGAALTELCSAVADMRLRLLALEKRNVASSGEPLSLPIQPDNPAVIAVPAAMEAVDAMPLFPDAEPELICLAVPGDAVEAQLPDISESESIAVSSGDVPDDLKPLLIGGVELEDLQDSLNGERNRRIIQMHLEGKNTNAISRALTDAGIERSRENSVRQFLLKRDIQPNKG